MIHDPRDCDQCQKQGYTVDNPRVFVCTQRPSDPAEMCCIMAGHANCLARGVTLPSIGTTGGTATGEQWETWIESPEAMNTGYCFLSL